MHTSTLDSSAWSMLGRSQALEGHRDSRCMKPAETPGAWKPQGQGPHLPSKGGSMEGGRALKAQGPWSAQLLQGFLEAAARPACSSWAEGACRQDEPSLQQGLGFRV